MLTSLEELPQSTWTSSDVNYSRGEFRFDGHDAGSAEWSIWRFSPAFDASAIEASFIPEPASLTLLTLGTLAMLRRRRA